MFSPVGLEIATARCLQANIREAWSKEEEVEKGIKSLTYVERLKERVKKVKIPELRRAPCSSPDLVPERKRTMPTNPAKFFQRLSRTVSQRPIRDRAANLDANENSFSLKEHFFKDIQEDWPGYTERDRQTLEVTLSRKPTPSQNATSTSQSPSLGPSEGDTPLRTAQAFCDFFNILYYE
ncbi:RNA polymerase II elongation factor ELL2-like isoform X2 [Passer domesticus]|uniref:RNA polymerase II elongation factor ELL2-like isoform X2 n=1 Tax=Passer domesticus TaxID=48849 RepID=UPI0030FEA8AC